MSLKEKILVPLMIVFIAEFYMAESERYKMLINERQEISQMAKSAIDRALESQKDNHA